MHSGHRSGTAVERAGAPADTAPRSGESSIPAPGAPGTVERPWWRATHLAPVAVVVGIVLVANGAYLSGVFDPNPINLYAGLSDLTRTGILAGLPSADPNTGITSQALGHLAALDWLHGRVPWWNPYEGLGAPLAGEMQSASFFPPTAFLLLPNGQVLLHLVLELIAGLTTYALLVRLRLSRAAAVAAAVAFALGGTFSWFSHAPVNPVPFLPLLLLGVELATDEGARVRRWGWAAVALGVAFSAYAGFPETAYIGGAFAAVWAIARTVELPAARRRAFGVVVVGGVATGLLLAAPILVAFLDYVRVADVGGHSGQFGQVSLPAAGLSQLFVPYVYGPIDAFSNADSTGVLQSIWDNVGGYLTISLLPLAIVGAIGAVVPRREHDGPPAPERHRFLRVLLSAWLLLALGRTFGFGPLRVLVNLVPGMHSVAFYRYSPPTWTMALAVLAALGFDDILRLRATRRTVCVALGLSGLVILGSVLEARGLSAHLAAAAHHRAWEWASVLWAATLVAGVGLAALFGRGGVRRAVITSIVLIDAVAMFVVPQLSAPRSVAYYPGPVDYLAAHLGGARFFTVGPLPANYGSYYGLASLNSNDVPQPALYDSAVARRLHLSSTPSPASGQIESFVRHLPQYEALGVAYLLAPGGASLPADGSGGLRRVYAGPSGEIFAVPHPAPLYSTDSGRCRVENPRLDAVRLRCARPTTLVRRELAMPGWTASVNGAAHPVGTRGAFQTVRVSAGESSVEFGFTPPGETWGLAAFLAGLLVLAALAVVPRRPARLARHRRGGLRPG